VACHAEMRGLVTCYFAVSFVCGVERRRCVVLGMESLWSGDFIFRDAKPRVL
jgi:hypothetical protein